LSKTLQKGTISAAEGQKLASDVLKTLSKDRNSESFNMFWERMLQCKHELGVSEPNLPRKRKRPEYFGLTEPSTHHYHTSPKDWYRQIYFESFDLVISCIKNRFDQPDFKIYSHLQEVLLQAVKGQNYEEHLNAVTNFFGTDLNKSSLSTQLELLPHIAASLEFEVKSFTIEDLIDMLQKLDHAQKLLQSEVVKVGKLMLVMPATNAISERAFSALKRIKTYLRSTTSDKRMNNLMVLHYHKSKTDSLDMTKVAKEFIERRDVRKDIFGTF